ncbi:MAG: carbohydrate kinase family protein [Thermoplasmataceae archaeon]|jgi:6-phosphofructokinase 1/ribokinase
MTGHLNIDMVLKVNRIPTEGSINVNQVSEVYGGTAGNFSMVAASLGVEFDLYSAVSEGTHSAYLDFLKSRNVNISRILIDKEDRGPVCYAASTGNDQVYYIYQGPMNRSFLKGRINSDTHYSYLHLGTGDPEELKYAIEYGSYDKAVFDPGQELSYRYSRDQVIEFSKVADIAILNDVEIRQVEKISGGKDPRTLFPNLIATHGSKGSTIYTGSESTEIGALKAPEVYDTVGAGDAFRAGLYLGLQKGFSLEESSAIGSVVSSMAIRGPLTGFNLSSDQIFNLFKENRNKLLGVE